MGNSFKVSVVSCDANTVVLDLEVPERSAANNSPENINKNFVGTIGFYKSLKLTEKAKTEKHIFPYYIDATYDVKGGDADQVYNNTTYGGYIFDSSSGTGIKKTMATSLPDTATTKYNTSKIVDVLSNDTLSEDTTKWTSLEFHDSEGNPIDHITTSDGDYSITEDHKIKFEPHGGFTGEVTQPVKYYATDDAGNTVENTLTITVDNEIVEPDPEPTSDPTTPATSPATSEPTSPSTSGPTTTITSGNPTKTTTSPTSITNIETPTIRPTTSNEANGNPIGGPTVQTDYIK